MMISKLLKEKLELEMQIVSLKSQQESVAEQGETLVIPVKRDIDNVLVNQEGSSRIDDESENKKFVVENLRCEELEGQVEALNIEFMILAVW